MEPNVTFLEKKLKKLATTAISLVNTEAGHIVYLNLSVTFPTKFQ